MANRPCLEVTYLGSIPEVTFKADQIFRWMSGTILCVTYYMNHLRMPLHGCFKNKQVSVMKFFIRARIVEKNGHKKYS